MNDEELPEIFFDVTFDVIKPKNYVGIQPEGKWAIGTTESCLGYITNQYERLDERKNYCGSVLVVAAKAF